MPFSGTRATRISATHTVSHVGSAVSPMETKKPTRSSSFMLNSALDMPPAAGCGASSMPMISAPRSPLMPTASKSA